MANNRPRWRRYTKAVVAAITVAAMLVADGVVHGTAAEVCRIVVAVAGVYGVYQARNVGGSEGS